MKPVQTTLCEAVSISAVRLEVKNYRSRNFNKSKNKNHHTAQSKELPPRKFPSGSVTVPEMQDEE